jgi:tetratricopeptide (TPR) repeat protein
MKKRLVLSICLFAFVPVRAAILGTPKTAEDIQKRLAEIPPEQNYRTRAVLYSELGTIEYKQGHWDAAIEAFDNSLTYGPPTILKKHIYLYMGKSYESSGRIDKAISAYEQAAIFDKRNWRRHRDLAGLYERENLLEKAVASYETALRYNPKEASVHFSLGRIFRQVSQYEKAETHLVSALDLGQREADVFSELSFVFENEGKYSEAAAACDETLTDASGADEWARLIYLSLLGRQPELTAKGFAGLRKKNVPDETIRFYEALKRYMDGNPAVENSQLMALFKDVLQ